MGLKSLLGAPKKGPLFRRSPTEVHLAGPQEEEVLPDAQQYSLLT